MEAIKLRRSDCVFKSDLPATFSFAAEDEKGGQSKFSGIANTGDSFEWFFGLMVIDFEGMKLKQKTGVLADHFSRDRIGWTKKIAFSDKGMEVEGVMLKTGDSAKEITAQAKEGFPFQMSIQVDPGSIEEVSAGKEVTVNGKTFTGPIMVLRDNSLVEVSFTSLGADANTEAQVFSKGEQGMEIPITRGGEMEKTKEVGAPQIVPLTKETLKASQPELHDDIRKEGFAAGSAGIKARFEKLNKIGDGDHKDKAYELAMSGESMEDCFAQLATHVVKCAKKTAAKSEIELDTTEPVVSTPEGDDAAPTKKLTKACVTLDEVKEKAKLEFAQMSNAQQDEFFSFEGFEALKLREFKQQRRR